MLQPLPGLAGGVLSLDLAAAGPGPEAPRSNTAPES